MDHLQLTKTDFLINPAYVSMKRKTRPATIWVYKCKVMDRLQTKRISKGLCSDDLETTSSSEGLQEGNYRNLKKRLEMALEEQ
ncbi:hypothetical protein CEXT_366271 [Caerostris extrusa]|uniref:Uncharacterized protein n=1 Tax=Caerostris extrusa TaxID=172846 RepID=A0AAV4P8V8_CAEEX|nr:hypothetical protein CEXT_366271 [Caerostris extrusa]